MRLVGAAHKVQRQRADVLAPLGQRGQVDRDHVQAVVQVLPKAAGLHIGRQVAVGGRHQAHVDLDLALPAQSHQRALLQRAQQLGLHGQRQLANLVQKDGAAVGLLKPARTGCAGAGECAFFIAKQLRLEQRIRNGRAVDLDEGPVAPPAGQVHGACEQLLARARLAQQQHGGLGLRHTLQLAQGLQQRRRAANEPVARAFGIERIGQHGVARLQLPRLLGHQGFELQQLPHQRGQHAQHRQVVVQVALAAADAVAGQHADGCVVDLDGQGDESHRLGRQLAARHRAGQKQRFGIDVLHDGGLPRGQHPAGDAFPPGVAPTLHLGLGEAVGVLDGGGARRAGRGGGRCVHQHDAPPVQAQQLAHQVQHLAQHQAGRQAAADEAHHLAHQQQLLCVPVGGGALGGASGGRWGHGGCIASSAPGCIKVGRIPSYRPLPKAAPP